MPQPIFVFTTLPDSPTAERIGQTLLVQRLAACVNIGAPVKSLYHWRGEIEIGHEYPMVIKSDLSLYEALETALRADHPYELPEIVMVSIDGGYGPYLQWIATETRCS